MGLETPRLWFTQPARGYPKPWLSFRIDGLMMNAFEVLQSNKLSDEIRRRGVHEYMKFGGPITMDSGGFLFMRRGVPDVTPEGILDLYEDAQPNYAVVLDYPIVSGLDPTERRIRILKTLENTKRMVQCKKSANPELIPVIHGYHHRTIEKQVKELLKIKDFNIIGIGSLVPSVFNTKGVGGIYNVVRVVSYVKRLLPTKIIHVFGVGSTLTMHLMFYAGADSIDTTSWRSKAAFGAIQLVGRGDRYISPRERHKKYAALKKEEVKMLAECPCPACRRQGLEGLKNSYSLRALHNAWVYQKEIEKTRKMMKDGTYENYVLATLRKTRLVNVLNLAQRLRKRWLA